MMPATFFIYLWTGWAVLWFISLAVCATAKWVQKRTSTIEVTRSL